MSKTTIKNGRLCNQIIRNLSLSLLAKKYDLHVEYSNFEDINNNLGINLHVGNKKYEKTNKITNTNYMKHLNENLKVDYNLNMMNDYFQTEEITTILQKHLKEQMKNIMDKNPYKERYNYNNNNDIFLHIRLDDTKRWNVGIDYYIHCIKLLQYNNIYIGTDNFNDGMIIKLKTLYPNIIFFKEDPIKTIQFASTCKNIILSHGTFSAVIGYLGFFSNVYFPNRNPRWCPLGLFTNKGFIPITIS